ncbi:hypothetical protein, partial [Streptomyces sp. NPDC003832]
MRFSGGEDRHRAVFWRGTTASAVRLWVDGFEVGAEAGLDSFGHWLGGRFLVVQAEGPDSHPGQSYGPGVLVTTIVVMTVVALVVNSIADVKSWGLT